MPPTERGRGEDVVARIASYNAGRERERLAMKYRGMRESAFAFFRGTAHLFWQAWAARARTRGDTLDRAPLVWCCGDLHLENFGAYRGDNRLPYFDLNDFDEGTLAPATWELARFVAGLHVAAPSLRLDASGAERTSREFIEAYAGALAAGKAAWIERATSKGIVRAMLRAIRRRTQRELLDAFTQRKGRERRLRLDGAHLLAASHADRTDVEALLSAHATGMRDPRMLRIQDVARRVAGLGSLGVRRYVVVVRGDGAPSGQLLLDIKQSIPSSLALARANARLGSTDASRWTNDAERVVAIEHRMQAMSPALLASVSGGGGSFVLRELQPRMDRLAIARGEQRRGALRRIVRTMGRVVAWDQLRAASREGAAHVDTLLEHAHDATWKAPLLAQGRRHAARSVADWRAYARAFDRGAFD